MAVITIDGKKLEVPDNKNVLECALDAGIYIPHLCHHKDLNPLGSCRMCIVEVNGQDGVMASCTLEAKDGMVITTKVKNWISSGDWHWNFYWQDIRKTARHVRNMETVNCKC